MKTLRLTLAGVALAAMFTGCVGPAGPEGPQGNDGAQGPAGVNGSYATSTSNPSDWTVSGAFLIAGYNVSIVDANADANGVIMVYFQTSSMSATQWAPLPDTYPISGTVEQTFTFNYDVGIVTLQLQNSDGSTPSAPAAFNFKVVVIPTSVLKQHPGLNTKDYEEVRQVMNLKS
jgi:hypothetical protein